jgi:hypothetical protein
MGRLYRDIAQKIYSKRDTLRAMFVGSGISQIF